MYICNNITYLYDILYIYIVYVAILNYTLYTALVSAASEVHRSNPNYRDAEKGGGGACHALGGQGGAGGAADQQAAAEQCEEEEEEEEMETVLDMSAGGFGEAASKVFEMPLGGGEGAAAAAAAAGEEGGEGGRGKGGGGGVAAAAAGEYDDEAREVETRRFRV
jgi:hypothetical protein